MKSNPKMESSLRLYAGWLNLYPQEFRVAYGSYMKQLFADQCRYAARENGTRGILFLWLRTLLDLAASLAREHLADPRAPLGLFEAVPNRPLPWKGVVLVPGIVFLVGQIGQLAGKDWFFLLILRAAYFLIVPVLLVWIIRRKFPIWGLIPLGILCRTLIDLAYRADFILTFSYADPASWFHTVYKRFPAIMRIFGEIQFFLKEHTGGLNPFIVMVLIASIAGLCVWIARRSRFPRSAVVWTALFGLISLTSILLNIAAMMKFFQWTLAQLVQQLVQQQDIGMIFTQVSYYKLIHDFGFLALILIGALAARRHARLALLLPLGYLIPEVLLGRFNYEPRFPYLLVAASAAALTYCVFVSVIAPLWIVRSASDRARTRAGTVGLLAAVGFIAAVEIVYLFTVSGALGWKMNALDMYNSVAPQILILAGIGLAVSLYRRKESSETKPALAPALS